MQEINVTFNSGNNGTRTLPQVKVPSLKGVLKRVKRKYAAMVEKKDKKGTRFYRELVEVLTDKRRAI